MFIVIWNNPENSYFPVLPIVTVKIAIGPITHQGFVITIRINLHLVTVKVEDVADETPILTIIIRENEATTINQGTAPIHIMMVENLLVKSPPLHKPSAPTGKFRLLYFVPDFFLELLDSL